MRGTPQSSWLWWPQDTFCVSLLFQEQELWLIYLMHSHRHTGTVKRERNSYKPKQKIKTSEKELNEMIAIYLIKCSEIIVIRMVTTVRIRMDGLSENLQRQNIY